MNRNILNRTILIISLIIVCIWSLPYLFLPNISMDESYYLGAALKVLNNDFFLTTYKFDKPFLISWLLSPGILMFGENYLGFRIPGLLFTLGCIFYIYKILKQVNSNTIFILPIISTLFISPFYLEHTISAYTEPFLLFFLLGMLNYSLKFYKLGVNKDLHKSYLFFFLATFTKFSSIMWGPILLFTYLAKKKSPYKIKNIVSEAKLFLYCGLPIIIPGLLYLITNKKKLSPVTWLFINLFVNNGDTDANKISSLFRFEFWISALGKTLGNSSIIITLIVVFASIYLIIKKKSVNTTMFGFLFLSPMVMHYFGLIASGAPLFTRYYFIFIPQILFVVIFFPTESLLRDKYSIPLKMAILSIMLIPNIASFLPEIKSTSSRTYSMISEELLDETLVLHNKANVWETRPFLQKNYLQFYCFDKPCQEEAQIGRNNISNQFLLTRDNKNEPLLLKSLNDRKKHIKDLTIENIDKEIFKFLKTLRLRKSRYEISYQIKSETNYDLHNTFHELNGLPISINLVRKKSNKGLIKKLVGEKSKIQINGRLVIANGPRVQHYWGDINALGIRIESLRLSGIDYNFVDLAPVIWKGYFIPFIPVDIRTKNYDILSINATNKELNLKIAEY